jgi:hypothetical protein
MLKFSALFLILASLVDLSLAWSTASTKSFHPQSQLRSSFVTEDDISWQDIWNYDTAMSTIYSTAFIASDWIKSLPCAVGVDCETPDELKLPAPKGHGVEDVDVMAFLNLKRAQPLKKP